MLVGKRSGPWVSGLADEHVLCPSDADIWAALERVQMANTIRQSHKGLDSFVEDGGTNYSVGERQLLCTARALVECSATAFPTNGDGDGSGEVPRATRIFLCDEATANIDLETDEQVHKVLLELDATVIMICHRLQHIHQFDRVVVLGDGKVVEEGTPAELMQRPDGALASLLAEAGLLPSAHSGV
jgi:ABC-type multidrug transport system fused ATPase/permease subunit